MGDILPVKAFAICKKNSHCCFSCNNDILWVVPLLQSRGEFCCKVLRAVDGMCDLTTSGWYLIPAKARCVALSVVQLMLVFEFVSSLFMVSFIEVNFVL
jgi:hypothetical protein